MEKLQINIMCIVLHMVDVWINNKELKDKRGRELHQGVRTAIRSLAFHMHDSEIFSSL